MFTRYFILTLGVLGRDYEARQLIDALRDLRELVQVGGFDPKLYGVTPTGAIREFVPASRTWTAPLAQHPLGAQATAKPAADQIAEQLAARAAAAVQ